MTAEAPTVSTRRAITRAWPYRLALLTAWATLVLIAVGGLVTSEGAGLAVPDWPTTFGYNMFLYPWSKMVGGVLYEHSHRLVGSLVGLLTIALALSLWVQERRPWVRALGLVALVAVIAQGVVGGLRVVLLQETLAIVHACLAQAFFALTVSLAVFTSPEWTARPSAVPAPDVGRLHGLAILTTGLIYGQLVSGAVLRHTGGALVPHIVLAALITVHVIWLAAQIRRGHAAGEAALVRPSTLLGGLLALQLLLGLGSYGVRLATPGTALPAGASVAVTTAHVVTGALMLGTSLVLVLRTSRRAPALGPVVGRGPAAERVPA